MELQNLYKQLKAGYFAGVTSDSREVKPGFVFVAVRGTRSDGHDFLDTALALGAAALVVEQGRAAPSTSTHVAKVQDTAEVLGHAASAFYGDPSHGLKVFGVTGTSGKTTSTYLLESILRAEGLKPGVIGTVNFRLGSKVYPSTHTTPGAVALQGLLAEMRTDGCDSVVMEVSSHALIQKRVAGVAFDAMAFTNLTPEHLDFHPSMEAYFEAKRLLFTEWLTSSRAAGKAPACAINVDDAWGERLAAEARQGPWKAALTTGLSPAADVSAHALQCTVEGIHGVLKGFPIDSPMVGAFNAANIAGMAGLALASGVSDRAVSAGIAALPGVPGRLEAVGVRPGRPRVWVDYAHKPDALEKVLSCVRGLPGLKRLIVVMGCGGDRDRQKRPRMGAIAAAHADAFWVTSDNPRTEDPAAIIREIVAGIPAGGPPPRVEPDRKKAIEAAIRFAQPGDAVLIAGKGHEDYQILGDKKIPFDDREVAALALTAAFGNQ